MAVVFVLFAYDPARLGHAVNKPGNADRLNLHHFGQPRLGGAPLAQQADKQPPLGRGKAKILAAQLEPLAHQSGGIMQQQAEFLDSIVFPERA